MKCAWLAYGYQCFGGKAGFFSTSITPEVTVVCAGVNVFDSD